MLAVATTSPSRVVNDMYAETRQNVVLNNVSRRSVETFEPVASTV